jgi:hypothetical protein
MINMTAEKWAKKNKWFGIDRKLTEKAFTVHALIVNKINC